MGYLGVIYWDKGKENRNSNIIIGCILVSGDIFPCGRACHD